ncbi:MAG: hypothetical protein IJU76_01510, partial [Desulfovibrionaceae bacterium]|nr:hypothetical protein [Desulfovibrionaceae bacterium]
MDSTTQFIDTLNLLTKEIEGLQSYITKTNQELTSICGKISRGDIRDRETRLAKLSEASAAVEKVRALAVYAFSTRVEKF